MSRIRHHSPIVCAILIGVQLILAAGHAASVLQRDSWRSVAGRFGGEAREAAAQQRSFSVAEKLGSFVGDDENVTRTQPEQIHISATGNLFKF